MTYDYDYKIHGIFFDEICFSDFQSKLRRQEGISFWMLHHVVK